MARETLIKVIAAALANARGARHGMPPVTNVLDALKSVGGGKLIAEVTEDADAALSAIEGAGALAKQWLWLPMSTAPMDGTKFDVWIGRDGYRITDVYWSDVQQAFCTDGEYGPEEPSPLAVVPAPTHWMPRPGKPDA
jgi:hypothetical protein